MDVDLGGPDLTWNRIKYPASTFIESYTQGESLDQWDYELVTINWPQNGLYTGLPHPVGGTDRGVVEQKCKDACRTAYTNLGYPCRAYEFTYNTADYREKTSGVPRCAIWNTMPQVLIVGNSCFAKNGGTMESSPDNCTLAKKNCVTTYPPDAYINEIAKPVTYTYFPDYEMEVRCSDTVTKRKGRYCEGWDRAATRNANDRCRFSLAIGSGLTMGNGDNECHGFAQRVQETIATNYTAVTFGRVGGNSYYLEKAVQIGSSTTYGAGASEWHLWTKYSHMRYKYDERFALIPSVVLVSFSLIPEFLDASAFGDSSPSERDAVVSGVITRTNSIVDSLTRDMSEHSFWRCIIVIGFTPNNFMSDRFDLDDLWSKFLHASDEVYEGNVTEKSNTLAASTITSSGKVKQTLKYVSLLNKNASDAGIEDKMTGGWSSYYSNTELYPNGFGHASIATKVLKQRSCWEGLPDPQR